MSGRVTDFLLPQFKVTYGPIDFEHATTSSDSDSKPGDTTIRNPYQGFLTQEPRDTGFSEDVWKGSWGNQRDGMTLHGQIFQNITGSYYGKEKKHYGNTEQLYAKMDTKQ